MRKVLLIHLRCVARKGAIADVVVEIGTEHMKYHLQKSFLTHYSDYFKKALMGPWEEAEKGIIPLHDVEPAVFNIFVDWLYTQKLPEQPDLWLRSAELPRPEVLQPHDQVGMLMIKLHVFADRFLVHALCQAMSRVIIAHYYNNDINIVPHYEIIIYAFQNLPPQAKLLDFFVELQCKLWHLSLDSEDDRKIEKQLPHDFLLRFMKRIGFLQDTGLFLEGIDVCNFHEHKLVLERQGCSHRHRGPDFK